MHQYIGNCQKDNNQGLAPVIGLSVKSTSPVCTSSPFSQFPGYFLSSIVHDKNDMIPTMGLGGTLDHAVSMIVPPSRTVFRETRNFINLGLAQRISVRQKNRISTAHTIQSGHTVRCIPMAVQYEGQIAFPGWWCWKRPYITCRIQC